jgi:ADP-ribose pyrophosphatase
MTKELPTLRGEALYIPFVGAIIERKSKNGTQVLLQTRINKADKSYNGSLEIPGGKMRAYEDVFATIRREVKEETGLDITSIKGEKERIDCLSREDTSSLIEPFCVTQMQNGPFIGLIFLCTAEGEPALFTEESKEIRWVDLKNLRKLVTDSPEKFYTPFLASLEKYLQSNISE